MSKKKPPAEESPKAELLSVMLEPHDDKSDQEVLDWLQRKDVDAEVLAERFISANIPPALVSAVEKIAHVSVKASKQTR